MSDKKALSLYIHIPYCVKKCRYCDFVSYTDKLSTARDYSNTIIRELYEYELTDYCVKTIFFGGGTPSAVDESIIENILNAIRRKCTVDDSAEITIECNPCTLTPEKLKKYYSMGINRLSIGVQSFDDNILGVIGRVHDSEKAIKCIKQAKEIGFDNISIDLMFSIPTQTQKNVIDSINECIKLQVTHISLYSLIIESGTPIKKLIDDNTLIPIDDDTDRNMYHSACERLKEEGYIQYEISNFAKKGFESRHNVCYWERGEYIGLGTAAHSFFKNRRYSNVSGIDEYIGTQNHMQKFHSAKELEKNDVIEEAVMLGLRMNNGFDISRLDKEADIHFEKTCRDTLSRLVDKKLISISNNRIAATDKGRDLLNTIIIEILTNF